MRYVVRNNFFGLELQGRPQDPREGPKATASGLLGGKPDEQPEGQKTTLTRGEEITSVGANPGHSERDDKNCHRVSQGEPLCAEPSGEPAYPEANAESRGEEAADEDGHVTRSSSNFYDDEIWESPSAAV